MAFHRPVRLLCTGDLHLGRFPTSVPVEERDLSVEHVWESIVDYAVRQRADALVLTGDVVDRDNRFFESFGPLRRGLERLGKAGIQTFAVAGNHDFDVLPELHDALQAKGFHLIGRGGSWETVPLEIEGARALYFAGWSFPTASVVESPLTELAIAETDRPVIGLLHGDLHQKVSRYVPLSLSDLNAKPVAAWILGHIHKPSQETHRSGMVLYPGSPQPLGLKEPGLHGPWMVEVAPGGSVRAEQVPLATLRYEVCEVNLEGIDTKEEFRGRVISSVEDHVGRLAAAHDGLRRVVCSIRYVGRTPLHRRLEEMDREVREEIPVGSVRVHLVGSTIATRLALDVEKLAGGNDPIGVVAGLILRLESDVPDEETAELLRLARDEMDVLHRKPAYAPLRVHGDEFALPDVQALRSLLREQALLLLDEMHAQRPAP